jgi:hypothetical protein
MSGEEGAFEFVGLRAGPCHVELPPLTDDRPGRIAHSVRVEALAGQTVDGVVVECHRGGVLQIEVVDAVTRAPIDGARAIGVSDEGHGQLYGNMYGNGRRSFHLIPGTYRLDVDSRGYRRSGQQVAVINADETTRLTVELMPPPAIKGIVLDPQGRPVWNATVLVDDSSPSEHTDEAGRFEVRAEDYGDVQWEGGHRFSLWVADPGRKLAVVHDVVGGPQTVRLTLRPYRTLNGRVVDADGVAVPAAKVTLDWRGKRFEAETDEQGRYELGPIPPLSADQALRLEANTGRKTWGAVDVLLKDIDAERVAVRDIVVGNAPHSVSGIVVDFRGRPQAGVVVEAYGPGQPNRATRTDGQGRFLIEGLVEGKVWLQVPDSPTFQHKPFDVGTRNIRLVQRPSHVPRR